MSRKHNRITYTRYNYEKRVKEKERLLAENKRREELCKFSMSRFLENASKTLLNK